MGVDFCETGLAWIPVDDLLLVRVVQRVAHLAGYEYETPQSST